MTKPVREFSQFYEKPFFKEFINVLTYKLDENATLPTRNLSTDAGIDIYALEDVFIPVGTTAKVKTGVAIKIPEGRVGKIEGRSSMNSKGLITAGGVIDSGYNGEIGVVMHNFSNLSISDGGMEIGYKISKGDKIAQLLIYKVDTPEPVEVKELWDSERGNNGFGSSGR